MSTELMPSVPAQTEGWECTVYLFENRVDLFKVIAGKDGQLGDLADALSKTAGVSIKNLATLPDQYFQKLYKEPAWEEMKGKLDEIFDQLDPETLGILVNELRS